MDMVKIEEKVEMISIINIFQDGPNCTILSPGYPARLFAGYILKRMLATVVLVSCGLVYGKEFVE